MTVSQRHADVHAGVRRRGASGPTSRPCDQRVHGKPLVYLDNAATTQKPRRCIDAIARYYAHDNANVHRGVHTLSERATDGVRSARARRCARSSTRASTREIVFTRNATEGINLVARAWGDANVGAGRRGAHHRDGAPLEHRAVAAAVRADGRDAATWRRSTTAATLMLDEFERLLDAADEDRRGRAPVERARHDQSRSRRSSRLAHARGAAGARRRIAGRAATCRSTSRRSAPTSTCSPATSSTARPASACSTAAKRVLEAMPPFLGGGDMIQHRDLREAAPGTTCRTSSRRARRTSRAPSASARRSTTCSSDRLRRDRRARGGAARARDRARCQAIAGRAHHRHGARRRRASCRSSWTASIRTTSARSSIAKASRSAPAITARSR